MLYLQYAHDMVVVCDDKDDLKRLNLDVSSREYLQYSDRGANILFGQCIAGTEVLTSHPTERTPKAKKKQNKKKTPSEGKTCRKEGATERTSFIIQNLEQ